MMDLPVSSLFAHFNLGVISSERPGATKIASVESILTTAQLVALC